LKEKSWSEGSSPEGADGGDARTESGTEEGLQRWKTSEADAWMVGEACAALGRGRARQMARGEEKDRSAAGGSVLRVAAGRGEGPKGWTPRGGGAGERERGGPKRNVEQHGGVASERPGRGALPCDSGERRGQRDTGRRG
jgi:hypothetical protein